MVPGPQRGAHDYNSKKNDKNNGNMGKNQLNKPPILGMVYNYTSIHHLFMVKLGIVYIVIILVLSIVPEIISEAQY